MSIRTTTAALQQRPRSLTLFHTIVLTLFGALLLSGQAHATKCPNLIIVLDRSGSMTSAPDGSFANPPNRRWDIAVEAVKKVAKEYNGLLPIGLSMFAPDGGCGGGKLDVPPDYDTEAKIFSAVDAADPDSATPTGDTITNLSKEPALRDPGRAQYMLLITDGEPNCGGAEPGYTVTALANAYKQVPSITTFVVGFGALDAGATDTMNQMAEAGGKPIMGLPGARKFYVAENAESLNRALADIFKIIVGAEVAAGCDDTCYTNGCTNPAEQCIRAQCKANPCAGVSCGSGRYCYTDGVSPGRCVASCTRRCRDGSRCEMGQCIPTDCPAPCIAGFVCNPASKVCEADPLCPDNRPVRQQCKAPSRCQGGTCVDDPCLFIKCPSDTRCVAWNGSCEYTGATANQSDGGVVDPELTGNQSRGCNASSSAAANGSSLAGGMLALVVGLLLRRRQRARSL